ncbi:MAG: hypothetical protein ACK515_24445 [bacterium]|jgi:hypothetical protein
MTTTYTVAATSNSPDLRAAADLINRRLGDAGETGDLRAVEQEIAECAESIRDGLVIEEERTYCIRDDAGSRDIQAASADDACAMYATIEGLRARTMTDLTAEIEAQDGYVYIHEDGVLLYQTAGI